MATEIERKFLLHNRSWEQDIYQSTPMQQGYLVSDETRSVRVRIAGDKAQLNIKSGALGVSRSEFEYPIPLDDAREILAALCSNKVEKVRHLVRYSDLVWEIDVFEGDNTGLIVAEVELDAADQTVDLPSWAGEEVSEDARYYNSELAKHPYKYW